MAFTGSLWNRVLLTGLAPSASTEAGFAFVITADSLPSWCMDAGSDSVLSGGGDIRIATDSDGTNQLPVKVVKCIPSAVEGDRKLEVWSRYPTAWTSASREVWFFCGKSGETQPIATDTYGAEAVFQDFEVFYGFDNASGLLLDYAGNYDLTSPGTPAAVPGVVGDAVESIDYAARMEATGYKGVTGATARTLTAWSNAPLSGEFGLSTWGGSSNYQRFSVWFQDGRLRTEIAGSFKRSVTSADGTFQRFTVIVDGSTFPDDTTHRVNAVTVADESAGGSQTINTASDSDLIVNAYSNLVSQNKRGDSADMFGLRAFAISDDLDQLEFNNQNDPAAFWTDSTVIYAGAAPASTSLLLMAHASHGGL